MAIVNHQSPVGTFPVLLTFYKSGGILSIVYKTAAWRRQMKPFVLLVVLLAAAPISAAAQTPNASARETLVASPAWLAQHLHDPDLVILQVGAMGGKESYDAGHIPGARLLDYDTVHAVPKNDEALAARRAALEAVGISDQTHIVIYSGDDYWPPATRALLMLNYVGLQHVRLLDGGLRGWIESGGTLSKDTPVSRRGSLSPLKPQPALIADAEFVKAHEGAAGFAIVDARNREFYEGVTEGGPRDHRVKGHIPGAVSAPFNGFAALGGHLKPASEIAAIFEKAGVKPGDTIIGYCHVGEQATAMLFAARTLGHPIVLYDGSFADWVRHDLPLELPKQEK